MPNDQTPQPIEVIRTNVSPQEIACQYLRHEFIKLFPNQASNFYEVMNQAIDNFPQTLGEKDFWQLVAAISEGLKLKGIYRLLTDTKYTWNLERFKLPDITMTSMSPVIDKVLKEAEWNPLNLPQAWKSNEQYLKDHDDPGLKPNLLTDGNPIILQLSDRNQLLVYDGMKRTCLRSLERKTDIVAWVCRVTNPNGQMMINADKVLYTRQVYSEDPDKDPQLLQAVITIMGAYRDNYRNGKELVERYISPWREKEEPELKRAAKDILDQEKS